MKRQQILVTGATGFVGRVVCQQLLDGDHRVVAAVRDNLAGVVPGCRAVVVGDIHGETAWQGALDGVDGVVHLAARTHQTDDADAIAAYRRLNVEGSAQLARCAVAAAVGVFVYMSSIKVNGESSPMDPNGILQRFDTDDMPLPTTPYGQSKWQAEQALQEIAAQASMRLIVLRPPLVYGPGQQGNLLSLMRAIDRGLPLPFAGLDNRRGLVDVGNLASAAILALTVDGVKSATYTLADVELSSADLVQAMASALGRRPRLFRLPLRLIEIVAVLIGRRQHLNKITGSLIIDSSAVKKDLGWMPKCSFEQSLIDAVDWYRAHHAQ